MKILLSCLLAASASLCAAAAQYPPVPDELSSTIAACGKPAADRQELKNQMAQGTKLRILTFKGIDLHFTTSKGSPQWRYSSAWRNGNTILDSTAVEALPCFGTIKPALVPISTKHEASDDGEMVPAIVWICFLLYLIPTAVAWRRDVAAPGGIKALNIFLGWTVLGWLIALIWACSAETKEQAKTKEFDYDKLAAAIAARDAKSK